MVMVDSTPAVPGQRKKINFSNILVGGMMNIFEVRFIPLLAVAFFAGATVTVPWSLVRRAEQ